MNGRDVYIRHQWRRDHGCYHRPDRSCSALRQSCQTCFHRRRFQRYPCSHSSRRKGEREAASKKATPLSFCKSDILARFFVKLLFVLSKHMAYFFIFLLLLGIATIKTNTPISSRRCPRIARFGMLFCIHPGVFRMRISWGRRILARKAHDTFGIPGCRSKDWRR